MIGAKDRVSVRLDGPLPSGWTMAAIGDLVANDGIFIDGDWVESKDQDPEGDVRLIQLADVGDGEYRDRSSRFLTLTKALELGCTFLVPGDVLIARMPDPLGRACIFPGDEKTSVTVVDVCIVRTGSSGTDHKWLMYAINAPQFRTVIANLQSGTTRQRISRGNLATIEFPVPPLAEQRRIVAAIEQHFTRLDAGTAALRRAQTALKRYRAAVLKSAVEGALTASWRTQHPITAPTPPPLAPLSTPLSLAPLSTPLSLAPLSAQADIVAERPSGAVLTARPPTARPPTAGPSGPSPSGSPADNAPIEPATALLARILAERRARWEADLRAKGKDPAKTHYAEPTAPDTATLPQLPGGWCWATVEQIGHIQGGIQKQPSRAPKQNAFPYLRVANVLRGRLDLTEIERMELFNNELETLRLEPGDLLIVEGNGSRSEIGRSAIWHGEIENCVHQNHIIRVRLTNVLPQYLDYYWNSPIGNQRVMDVAASTSGLYTLSVGKIAKLPVPLPPLAEQEQIVAEVERRLSVVAELEAAVAANLKRAERLRQSILREAFAGRLVPQDSTDEPASALLERIQREQEQHAGKSANGRKQESIPVRQEALWHD